MCTQCRRSAERAWPSELRVQPGLEMRRGLPLGLRAGNRLGFKAKELWKRPQVSSGNGGILKARGEDHVTEDERGGDSGVRIPC